ncbi:vomeronasal type-2 receptor 26-like [Hyperolius riggenbachi]|uniref:vomeronasal type-2 receptor 26-like n=1 Tax=Hyperolius riggenbachi TaxID=752182 RepID=UPI0035A324E2
MRRNCTKINNYEQQSQMLMERFIEKGYQEEPLRQEIERIKHINRDFLVRDNQRTQGNRQYEFAVCLDYNTQHKDVDNIIRRYWGLLCNDPVKTKIPLHPKFIYKKANNLQMSLVKKCISEAPMHHYLRKITFSFDSNEPVPFFNEHGEFASPSKVTNWVLHEDQSLTFRDVGTFTAWASEDQQLQINTSLITWKRGDKVPVSRCSVPCLPGSRKIPGSSIHKCCYGCTPCAEGEISNTTDSENCMKCPDEEWPNEEKDRCLPKLEEFLSYTNDSITAVFSSLSIHGFVLTGFIFGIFIYHRDTPIVKANNRNLSYVLLVSIMLCFLCVFFFLGPPVDVTCRLRVTSFGIIFSVAVSSLLAKTVMVFIAFNASKPGNSWKKWMGYKLSNCIMLVCSSVQVIICVTWVSISPPFQERDTRSYQAKIILQCNEGSALGFFSVLGYMGILAAVSFITAFLARTLPDSFNEAKYITFSMLVFCSVWIAMIPAYLSTKGKYMVAVQVFAIMASSTGLIGCIFFQKCYIILLKPDHNTKTHLLGSKIKL